MAEENREQKEIEQVLEETEILKSPDGLIATTRKTTLHYYVLAEPYYLEVFTDEGPETKIREGTITWEKPKLLTPEYMLKMEGFSDRSKNVLKKLARQHPDLAGLLYKMKYKKGVEETETVSRSIEETMEYLKDEIEDEDQLTVIIKGVDEYWDVSLMKFIQELVLKSAFSSQLTDLADKGYVRIDEDGTPAVTRNFEGLPLAAREEIERMFAEVRKGDLDPSRLKNELDRWGVYASYEDRFLNLFRKG